MQTVQDWLNSGTTQKPQQNGGLKSVSDWMLTQPIQEPQAPALSTEPKKPSLGSKIVTGVKDYANESANVLRAFPDKVVHPVRSLMNFADTLKSEWMAGVTKAGTPVDKGNFTTDISNLVTGVAQAAFSPITAFFKAAEAVPGLKQVADVVNLPFMGLGLGGSFVADKVVDVLPDSVASQETKEVIREPLKELGSLSAQLLLGAKVMEKIGEVSRSKKKGETVSPEEARKIIVESKSELNRLQIETPTTKHEKYAEEQGYERYKTAEELPTIEFGSKPKSTLPVVDLTTGKIKQPVVKSVTEIVPIEQAPKLSVKEWQEAGMPKNPVKPTEPVTLETTKVIEPTKNETATKQPEAPIKLETKPTDPVQIEKANSRVYERMKNENPELTGDIKYTPISLKQEVIRAGDILVKDRQEAFDIAMGKKSSPDVTSTSMNIVMAEKALQDGNIELFSRLTKKRSLDQTRRGQEIVSEKSSVSDNSVSRYVRELVETRLNILGNSFLGKSVEFITKQSPKQKATKVIDREVTKLTSKINSRKLDVKTALDLLEKLKCV